MFSRYMGKLSLRLHDLITNLTCLGANCLHLLYIHEFHIYYLQPTKIIHSWE